MLIPKVISTTTSLTMMMHLLLLLWLAPSLSMAFIPTGDCSDTTGTNGGRVGYHSPSPTDVYLPDCQNPLQRELWRVFVQEDGTAYMIPRPDGLGITYGLCNNDAFDQELMAKAQQYGLCDETVTDPTVINSMTPEDALRFANAFHRQLRFSISDDNQIYPWAPDEDILLACENITSQAALGHCEALANRCNDDTGECIEIGVIPSVEAVQELVPALNALYGVLEEGETCIPSTVFGPTFGCPVADCFAEQSAGCEYDTAGAPFSVNELGDCCQRQCYAVDSNGNECTGNNNPQEEKIGEECDPASWGTDPNFCPVAKCVAPPEGCNYVFDHYVVNGDGNCCASLCYAVDDNDNQCNISLEGDEEEDTSSNGRVGSTCNATETGTDPCPVAGCTEAPEGCDYVTDHFVFNMDGHCCPSLCYAVDANGNECTISLEGEEDTSNGLIGSTVGLSFAFHCLELS
ncbi:expressed unknown protein [Seminavis robusta]|uniref:Uncharacterized protein n=1 Tax=Seminavis robusta TaxID=568900 RepID=A0A9N8ERP7_9STRA|nr:expressed unknown protein [Seminavis robusta]|eukprot:Sro1594_g284630.1 n/a (461) ;mRNA; r:20852-22234